MDFTADTGGSSADSANAKRKLEIAPAMPLTTVASDSQSKVRRRGSSLSANDNSAMKRSLSDGIINTHVIEAPSTKSRSKKSAASCPISPSSSSSSSSSDSMNNSTTLLRVTSPSDQRPSTSSQNVIPFSPIRSPVIPPGSIAATSPKPNLFTTPVSSPCHANIAPVAPMAAPLSTKAPALVISVALSDVEKHLSPVVPSLGRGNSGASTKRTWQPSRKNRNPGNLSLDLSQVDPPDLDEIDGKCAFRRNDDAATCSRVTDFLFIGGATAAKDRDNLTQVGVTHIINCAATITPSFHPDAFQYYNIRLRDHSSQDIARYFYNVFDFIEKARQRGGKILVHCVKGISRSPTMAIAYLMWYKRIDMYTALDLVRHARPAVDPNAGFIFQLTEWEHLRAGGSLELEDPVLFRVDVPDGSSGTGNGARAVERPLVIGPLPSVAEIDFLHPTEEMAKSCYVVSNTACAFIWCGAFVNEAQMESAQHAVALLQAYESFPDKWELTTCGQESHGFWEMLESSRLRCKQE